jgi:hypothetical protein
MVTLGATASGEDFPLTGIQPPLEEQIWVEPLYHAAFPRRHYVLCGHTDIDVQQQAEQPY